MAAVAVKNDPLVRRRDWQREETRRDLALAAFELTRASGPGERAGSGGSHGRQACPPGRSTIYFASKEQAVVWL
jgi:hypothetical protein